MKVGDLCWVFEGCKKTLERPVIYMGLRQWGSTVNNRPYHVAMLSDGTSRTFPDYFYTFIRVTDRHIL